MQEKVAVGEAVVAGYRFGFGRVGAVIGAAWLPLLVLVGLSTAASFLTVHQTFAAGGSGSGSMVGIRGSLLLMPLNMLLQSVFEGMAAAGVMSVALGRRKAGYVYFSFGPAALRMIAAFAVINIVVAALCALLVGVFVAAAYGLGVPLPGAVASPLEWLTFPLRHLMFCGLVPGTCSPVMIVALVILALAEFAVLVYVMVRLTFFLPAVVVSEERIGFGRAWNLTGGNFWRVVAVEIGVTIPLIIIAAIAQHYATKLMLPDPLASFGGAPRSTNAIGLALQGMPLLLIVTSALSLIERVVVLGLESGAQAHAYNDLTMADAPDVF